DAEDDSVLVEVDADVVHGVAPVRGARRSSTPQGLPQAQSPCGSAARPPPSHSFNRALSLALALLSEEVVSATGDPGALRHPREGTWSDSGISGSSRPNEPRLRPLPNKAKLAPRRPS